ncbi:MAG TPA: CBS domain-containing protein [Longimicrobiales bacterium]
MKAREIMTSTVECVTRQDSLSRAAQIMRDSDVGSVPVVDDRNSMRLVGVITDRDIAVRHVAGDNSADCSVGDHMTSGKIFTVRPDDDVKDVMRTMKSEQVRRVPVTDGERLVGIIAQADIATGHVGDKETGDVVEKVSEPAHPRR